jgi:hypothetical protein
MEQEPEFEDYAGKAFIRATTSTAPDALAALYQFYQIGMTLEQATQFIINASRMNGTDRKKEPYD